MDILLSIEGGRSSRPVDVRVHAEPSHQVGELAAALSQHVGLTAPATMSIFRSDRWESCAADQELSSVRLASGDRVSLAPSGRAVASTDEKAVVRLAVTSGPDAGRSFALPVGSHSVGRSPAAMIRLSDPRVSRQHFVIDVAGPDSVELFPRGDASHPPRVHGEAVTRITRLQPGDVVQVGATRLRVREPLRVVRRSDGVFGQMPFHRTPYFRTPIPTTVIKALGDLPLKPKPRRFQVIAALSPMLMGIAMAAMLGSMRYLLFAFASPVMAAGSWWDQRRTGGREYDEKVAAFDERAETRQDEINAALRAERSCRLQNNPDIELLARRVESGHNELWQRDRKAPDFLSLRVGVGRGASQVSVEPDKRGDDEFLAVVNQMGERAKTMADVPIAIDVAALGTIALVGEASEIDDLSAALIVQACCLHSPEDLVVMAAVSPERHLAQWMKWLPHARASSSPLAGTQLADDQESTDALLRDIARIAELRAGSTDRQVDRRWPWLLVALDRTLEPDASLLSRILDLGVEAGISVLWLTHSDTRVPRQAEAEVLCQPLRSSERSLVRFTDPARPEVRLDAERTSAPMAATIARALAPMSDATAANAVTAIPRVVPLFASLGVTSMTADWITEQWSTDRGYSLPAPIGMTDAGPIELDLVEHGPHGLIGGTSGAGKSELVQSLVANLAVCNSPERINFLFVDYKGGALSEMFKDIPHTVGAVTNLDALLALRALTSLTAELDRRMELFKGRAPDIKEMLAKYPDEAPPSLVIVVDEFAALVRELPEFVDGIVSIAERGRSLGIHLIMSTQRPSGAINDNIQQNTNLRIALRMLDSGESNNVIGAPDAATIPVPLKGRGLVRLGPGELLPFQSAWSGAPLLADQGPPPVSIATFGEDTRTNAGGPAPRTSRSADPDRTQLDATIACIIEAANQLTLAPGRAPWKEALASEISLGELLADPRSRALDRRGERITIGMVDDPAAQDQYPGQLDFAETGAAVIFGNSGSGKSTLLKTIAAAAALRDSEAGGGGLTIFGLDFASRQLGLLARFPQTSAIVTGDDLEGVTRVLATIDEQLERRRGALAAATSRGDEAPLFSRILVLIDGYENLVQTFEAGQSGGRNAHQWVEVANRLIAEGRQYGIDVAFTAGRRGAVRSSLMSSLTNRFVLRQADDSGYTELGIPSKLARGLELAPGQGFNSRNQSMQFAIVSGAPGQPAEADDRAAMIAFAESLTGHVAPELVTEALPVEIPLLPTPSDQPNLVQIGITDRTLQTVGLDLQFNNVVVAGPPRSGKSSVLRIVAEQMVAVGRQVWIAGAPGSPLDSVAGAEQMAFGRLADIVPLLEEMATSIESFPGVDRVLIFDDVDQFDDRSMTASCEAIVEAGVRIVGSVSGLRGYGSNPLYAEMKAARTQLVLRPEGPREVQELVGVMPDMRPGLAIPPGRGVLVVDRIPAVVQVSNPEAPIQELTLRVPSSEISTMPAPATSAETPLAGSETQELAIKIGENLTVVGDALLIGRRPVNDDVQVLTYGDACMSKQHLLIARREDRWFAIDQASRNGTLLRRESGAVQRLDPHEPTQVAPGDQLRVGTTTIVLAAH